MAGHIVTGADCQGLLGQSRSPTSYWLEGCLLATATNGGQSSGVETPVDQLRRWRRAELIAVGGNVVASRAPPRSGLQSVAATCDWRIRLTRLPLPRRRGDGWVTKLGALRILPPLFSAAAAGRTGFHFVRIS